MNLDLQSVPGTGKSAVMRNVLAGMEGDNIISTTINLNTFSDAPSLQPILENPLEKKSGKYCCPYSPPLQVASD